jgi:hypothetical protein
MQRQPLKEGSFTCEINQHSICLCAVNGPLEFTLVLPIGLQHSAMKEVLLIGLRLAYSSLADKSHQSQHEGILVFDCLSLLRKLLVSVNCFFHFPTNRVNELFFSRGGRTDEVKVNHTLDLGQISVDLMLGRLLFHLVSVLQFVLLLLLDLFL